jgi:hypothetical protein
MQSGPLGGNSAQLLQQTLIAPRYALRNAAREATVEWTAETKCRRNDAWTLTRAGNVKAGVADVEAEKGGCEWRARQSSNGRMKLLGAGLGGHPCSIFRGKERYFGLGLIE